MVIYQLIDNYTLYNPSVDEYFWSINTNTHVRNAWEDSLLSGFALSVYGKNWHWVLLVFQHRCIVTSKRRTFI